MASPSKKRSLSKIELETIDYHLEQRKRPCLQPNGSPLPSNMWKPLFSRLVQENLGKSPADADQLWNGLIDRITAYIQDNGLAGLKRRRLEDRKLIKSQLAIFAQMPESKLVLDVFDEPIRDQILASLEVNSRQRIRDSVRRAKVVEPKAIESSSLPLPDNGDNNSLTLPTSSMPQSWDRNTQRDTTIRWPLVYTSNKDKSQGAIIDIDRFKMDRDLPIAEDNLDFEQYLTHLERVTDFKRHKDSLSWILPSIHCNNSRTRSRIIDETDWSLAITLQLCSEGNYLEFEFSTADETSSMSAIPLAVTMGRIKGQPPLKTQKPIFSKDI